MTALERLDRIAKKAGWRLRWHSAPLAAAPAMTCTELDIFDGKRLVTRDGAVWVIHGASASARESIARLVLGALPKRSSPTAVG